MIPTMAAINMFAKFLNNSNCSSNLAILKMLNVLAVREVTSNTANQKGSVLIKRTTLRRGILRDGLKEEIEASLQDMAG